jgi:hypothetical protein
MPIELQHEQRYVQGFSALLFCRDGVHPDLTRPAS